jgi:dihydroorotase-like cyclic amidohydrolase
MLWSAIESGSLDFAASDHAPAPKEQKETGSIWTDYAGIPGSGTMFPYLFSEGYATGRLSLTRLLETTSGAAAKRYGLHARKGAIRVGLDGDFVLVDPAGEWTIKGEEFLSKGKVTPFEGMRLTGRVQKTIVRGRVTYDADTGITVDGGWGTFLRRSTAP